MATLKEQIEKVTLDSLRELKERSESGENLSAEEQAQLGEFMRLIYLEEGENTLLLNEEIKRKKGTKKSGELVYSYIIKCENSKGRFDLWLSSFDSVAFTALYNKKNRNENFACKPKSVNLDDLGAVGTATQLLRESNNQVDFICRLIDDYADENGKVKINVKRHTVGANIDDNTKANAVVAVQYVFGTTDTTKPYVYKESGKTLFEIDLVE